MNQALSTRRTGELQYRRRGYEENQLRLVAMEIGSLGLTSLESTIPLIPGRFDDAASLQGSEETSPSRRV